MDSKRAQQPYNEGAWPEESLCAMEVLPCGTRCISLPHNWCQVNQSNLRVTSGMKRLESSQYSKCAQRLCISKSSVHDDTSRQNGYTCYEDLQDWALKTRIQAKGSRVTCMHRCFPLCQETQLRHLLLACPLS